MKKTVAILLVFVMAFFACSCGGKNSGENPEDKYVFESDKSQKVYKNNNNYLIFYYKKGEISGIDTVMTFPTEEVAISSMEVLEGSNSKSAGDIVREGKYIVIHMSEEYISDYNKMSDEGVESYLKGQGYVLVEKIEDETTAEQTNGAPATTAAPTESAATKADEKTTAKPAEATTAAEKK